MKYLLLTFAKFFNVICEKIIDGKHIDDFLFSLIAMCRIRYFPMVKNAVAIS